MEKLYRAGGGGGAHGSARGSNAPSSQTPVLVTVTCPPSAQDARTMLHPLVWLIVCCVSVVEVPWRQVPVQCCCFLRSGKRHVNRNMLFSINAHAAATGRLRIDQFDLDATYLMQRVCSSLKIPYCPVATHRSPCATLLNLLPCVCKMRLYEALCLTIFYPEVCAHAQVMHPNHHDRGLGICAAVFAFKRCFHAVLASVMPRGDCHSLRPAAVSPHGTRRA